MRFGNEVPAGADPQSRKVILANLIQKTQRESNNSAPGTGLADPTGKIDSVTSLWT